MTAFLRIFNSFSKSSLYNFNWLSLLTEAAAYVENICIHSIVGYIYWFSHIIKQYIQNWRRVLYSFEWSCNFTTVLLLCFERVSIYFFKVLLNMEINYSAWVGYGNTEYFKEDNIFIDCGNKFADYCTFEPFFCEQFL